MIVYSHANELQKIQYRYISNGDNNPLMREIIAAVKIKADPRKPAIYIEVSDDWFGNYVFNKFTEFWDSIDKNEQELIIPARYEDYSIHLVSPDGSVEVVRALPVLLSY